MSRRPETASSLFVTACGLILCASCRDSPPDNNDALPVPMDAAALETLRPAVTAFCGDCHASPPPESFPQDAWFSEVEQGYRFYLESGRSDLKPPVQRDVVDYFRSQAPKTIVIPSLAKPLNSAISFRKQPLPPQKSAPAVSCLTLAPQLGPGALWMCDLHSGDIAKVTWEQRVPAVKTIGSLAHPAHVVVCDVNQDGRHDLLVADLGSFVPGDHDLGRAVWLPGAAEPDCQSFVPQTLLDQVGRVADVRSADFDGDGDEDLVVAEFGWRKTGKIHLLLQSGSAGDGLKFDKTILDERHGAIHVPVADLNHDGQPDIVALISQEHEVIEAFINRGTGVFDRQRIFAANDPAFGFSGIELVDLDGDGDQDVLATNGDTLDSHSLKPSHGVFWLENQGAFPFLHHRLAQLPGAMRAVPADLDNDGDLDVVAAAFLPATLHSQRSDQLAETLIWIEQTEAGLFERHTLEAGDSGHMTVLAADFDDDGDLDIVVPNYAEQRTVQLSPLIVWWQEFLSGGTGP